MTNAEWVARSRTAQGLTPTVTDPMILATVARMLTENDDPGATSTGAVHKPVAAGSNVKR